MANDRLDRRHPNEDQLVKRKISLSGYAFCFQCYSSYIIAQCPWNQFEGGWSLVRVKERIFCIKPVNDIFLSRSWYDLISQQILLICCRICIRSSGSVKSWPWHLSVSVLEFHLFFLKVKLEKVKLWSLSLSTETWFRKWKTLGILQLCKGIPSLSWNSWLSFVSLTSRNSKYLISCWLFVMSGKFGIRLCCCFYLQQTRIIATCYLISLLGEMRSHTWTCHTCSFFIL